MDKIQELVNSLGEGVTFPSSERNYCTYEENRSQELLNAGSDALPFIEEFLKTSTAEEQVLDALQILDKMIDRGVEGIDRMYPTLARFNDNASPNIQVMLAGIYRKTLVPDGFGPLCKMLIRQSLHPNSKYFDPTEEIGGAIYEYLRHKN